MSENLDKNDNNSINKKPWLQPLLDYFILMKNFNDKIEIIREKLCQITNFNPIKLFIFLDFEKNGFLTPKNIIHFLEKTKPNFDEQHIRYLIHTYDKDEDYNLNFNEFINLILPIKNETLREKILNKLKEKSDKNNNNNDIPNEVNIIFNELITEELFFINMSLKAIKKIYDSPKFTTYDVFIDIVKKDSYITNENLSLFLKENNFQIKHQNDLYMIMFRIDADNDNKISYPEFQDIFFPLKYLEKNNAINEAKKKIKQINNEPIKKEKENIDINTCFPYTNHLNYNYDIYKYDFRPKSNKKYQLLNNNINYKNNSEKNKYESAYYQNFINNVNYNLEKIKTNIIINNDNYHIKEKQKNDDTEIKIIDDKKNKINIDLNNRQIQSIDKNYQKINSDKYNFLSNDRNKKLEKSLTFEIKLSSHVQIEKNEQLKKTTEEKKEIKEENKKDNITNNNSNNIKENNNLNNSIKKEEIINSNNIQVENIEDNKKNQNNTKLYESQTIKDKYEFTKTNIFDNLKLQNCFRFAINKKSRKRRLVRNLSDIVDKNHKNYEYTSITERILNNSQKSLILNNKNNPNNNITKKMPKYKLNFNSLNLYNIPKNDVQLKKKVFLQSNTNRRIDLTNYFKFKDSVHNSDIKSKTSRITNTKIKKSKKNKALFNLLNNYIIQDLEIEKTLEKLYLCSDFNIYYLFQTFLGQENTNSFTNKIITSNDIYRTLINLGLDNLNQKDISYIFLKCNKKINIKEKNNNIGFTYEEFCNILKPKIIKGNFVENKYKKYFMGFSFRTKRIICTLFKQFIDTEKMNEIFRKNLISNEKNKYKAYLIIENLFNSLKGKYTGDYLEINDLENFMELFGTKLQKIEKDILIQRFDKNKDGYFDFNDFFNEIMPKLVII